MWLRKLVVCKYESTCGYGRGLAASPSETVSSADAAMPEAFIVLVGEASRALLGAGCGLHCICCSACHRVRCSLVYKMHAMTQTDKTLSGFRVNDRIGLCRSGPKGTEPPPEAPLWLPTGDNLTCGVCSFLNCKLRLQDRTSHGSTLELPDFLSKGMVIVQVNSLMEICLSDEQNPIPTAYSAFLLSTSYYPCGYLRRLALRWYNCQHRVRSRISHALTQEVKAAASA